LYDGAVTLGANNTLSDTASGNIHFFNTVNGAFGLTVNTGGVTEFSAAVGGATALASLTTDAPGSTVFDPNVTTTGAQTYNDPVVLLANATFISTGSANIRFAQTVNGGFALGANTAGVTIFSGVVGGTTPLASITTDAPGSTQINGGAVTTSGNQTY